MGPELGKTSVIPYIHAVMHGIAEMDRQHPTRSTRSTWSINY